MYVYYPSQKSYKIILMCILLVVLIIESYYASQIIDVDLLEIGVR